MVNAISSSGMVSGIGESLNTDTGVFSLEDRLIQAFSKTAAYAETEKSSVMQKTEQPGSVTNPAELYNLQVRTSNYNLELSLISTLTRKCTGAVETLLRS
ncbi:type III secretion system inner rod subunit SctI [Salmonella enterica]|nr:type III secretion system protein PrgJ [Salmonella enterica subsp. enterica serovar Freetown]EBN9932869.1 type III secretion system protein PrgJ [Salmonella enterica]EDV9774756.1 type III secretion system protein PrgJ [Salmonella enterica subsp. enterica serovar Poona]EBH8792741.1 type III secretion system protein PrgJ [Salmonella enterica subsp. enterica serovar Freetown]EBP0843370.1 type III secretion system protein PrgJ [Salmonella enterica]